MPGTDDQDSSEVTISVILDIPSGRETDFEEYLQGITDAAEIFPGFIGVRAFRPRRGSGRTYRVVLQFDNHQSLVQWRDSDERQLWNDRAVELSDNAPRIANITGTSQANPLSLALTPLEEFVRTSISGIGLLLLGTVVALVMANSRLSDTYTNLWNTTVTIGSADYGITESLRHWVNDGLMALFFFIVGLEIKREVLVGDLRQFRRATLPIAAALGGAVVPAACYLLLNRNGASHGWGVPIGTDTAFSLGILSLLTGRVRPQLLVFLTAFAIIDDIFAVGVIAVFYTDSINWGALGVAAILLALLVVVNRAGFHRWPAYAFLGIGVWLAIFESGVHGTIAGVLVAMIVPARSWINPSEFLRRGRHVMDEFERLNNQPGSMLSNEAQQHATQRLQRLTEEVQTPMTYLEHGLNPWVSYVVLPLFAFANAGIPLTSGLGDALTGPVTWGVITGLVIGKPIGITLFAWIAIKTGLALRPEEISWSHIVGVAGLGGIGFTMSLFISELAFNDELIANHARIGVLVGSVISGIFGYLMLRKVLPAEAELQAEAATRPT